MKLHRFAQNFFLSCLILVPAQACAQAVAASNPQLSSGAKQVAGLIGLNELIERLQNLPVRERGPGQEMSLEAMKLRQQIAETVLTASLEADGVIAEIDSETEKLVAIRSLLEARRDRALQIGTVANLVTSGAAGIIGTSLQFSDGTAKAGNWVGIAGNSLSTLLSLIGIRQQQGGKYALRESPNMLAPLFGREAEYHATYPEVVWQYLSSPVPTEPEKGTRRERLRKNWIEFGRIDEKETAKSKDKIVFLTSRSSEQRRLTIDLINDRAAMLVSVKVWVELMKRDLSKLMIALRTR